MSGFELSRIAKEGGPLTKTIALGGDGVPVSDGSACIMSRGRARRFRFGVARQLADLIDGLTSGEAITLGALRRDLPDEVAIIAKDKLNGAAGVVARTQEYFVFESGAPAFALLDFDRKGMLATVSTRLDELGGLLPALVSVVPTLAKSRARAAAVCKRRALSRRQQRTVERLWRNARLYRRAGRCRRRPVLENTACALLAGGARLDDDWGRWTAARTLHR
jgi:hypothetical protein